MLAMSHQIGSKIHIGNGFIEILDVRPSGRIRIGYTFDKSVNVRRDEVMELGTLNCGSLGHIKPNGFVDAIRAASVDDDCDDDPLPRFMTPMQNVDYYTRGIDKQKNHHHED